MNWTEITVSVPLEYTDTAAAIANMTVPYGIYMDHICGGGDLLDSGLL